MKYTGERFIPNCDGPEIEAEHVHRYRIISGCSSIKGMKVLDAGCGTGYGSFILAQSAESVIGIDISHETIEWCKEHYEVQDNLTFKQASLEELPFIDAEFDCIINFEVIEHVDKNIQRAFLKEAKRVLKSTGVIIMSTPNKRIYTDKSGYHNPFHVSEFYEDEFINYLAEEFEAIKMYNQSIFTVSSILNETEASENVRIIKNNDIDSNEKYMIALCGSNQEAISVFDLNSVYKFNNPIGVSIASLYSGTVDKPYSQLSKESKSLNASENNEFSITFDISQLSGVTQFRFDPIEDHFCVCNIQETLTDGSITSILPLNALEYHKIGFVFMNIDPQFEIKGDFSDATYLTLKGYFKPMSQVEISEFVDAFYIKMMSQNKEEKLLEGVSGLISETNKLIVDQTDSFLNFQKELVEQQKELIMNSKLIFDQQTQIYNNTQLLIRSEEEILENIISKFSDQNEFLLSTSELLLKRKNLFRKIYKYFFKPKSK
ncbi:class I SAM-dependent methyltransferase [Paenibacillus sp. LjRoot56]|uniref:class I SAM-dependent methyltransferase n=1 Tax=Paenibacillus sp. LjRoot56 TaxID=3342333 RepID=UPI003ED02175